MSYFELGGIQVLDDSSLELTQTYDDDNRSSLLVMGDGNRIKQTFFPGRDKLKVTTQGKGWHSLGLSGLDWSSELLMKCASQRSIDGLSNIIVIPAERRSDTGFEPHGFAKVDGEFIATDVSLVVDTVTLTTVVNATGYRVDYWPEFNVLAEKKPPESWNNSGNDFTWSFVAFQV